MHVKQHSVGGGQHASEAPYADRAKAGDYDEPRAPRRQDARQGEAREGIEERQVMAGQHHRHATRHLLYLEAIQSRRRLFFYS